MKKIVIIGSGKYEKVKKNLDNIHIYCNSSVIRAFNKKFVQNLVLSESSINLKEIFKSNLNILGKNKLQSFDIRKYKLKSLDNVCCKNLIISSNIKNKQLIKKNIKKLNIRYKKLYIINDLVILKLILKYISLKKILIFFLSQKLIFIKFIFKILIRRELIGKFRPSTGVIAILWAKTRYPNIKIFLNGINNQMYVYYPYKKKNIKVKFNLIHKGIDELN